jgi:septum formation protein
LTYQLILASASHRRLDLMCQIGIKPDKINPPEIDENPIKNEMPGALALRLAKEKATKVASSNSNCFIIAADTVVSVGKRIVDKPRDISAAKHHLELLSGRRHMVYGGICILAPNGKKLERLVKTIVRFKRLTSSEIEMYLSTGEWKGKSGGYAIQGYAAYFIPWINGSYTNVVGLDVSAVKGMLTGIGYLK